MPPTLTIASAWLPTTAAAQRLGVHVRTLQRRARAGRIETRTAPDGAVEYLVTPPPVAGGRRTMPPASDTPGAATLDLDRLERLLERALRAELELEHARAELAKVTAAALDLEARHVRRGALLRRVAAELGAANRTSVRR